MTTNQTHNPTARGYVLAFIGFRAEWTCECGAANGNFATIEDAGTAAHQHQEQALRDRLLDQLAVVR